MPNEPSEKLLPCPFCGGENIDIDDDTGGWYTSFDFYCRKCRTRFRINYDVYKNGLKHTKNFWNARPTCGKQELSKDKINVIASMIVDGITSGESAWQVSKAIVSRFRIPEVELNVRRMAGIIRVYSCWDIGEKECWEIAEKIKEDFQAYEKAKGGKP